MITIIMQIALWGIIQACLGYATMEGSIKLTKSYGAFSLLPWLFGSTIVGALVALMVDPIYLIGSGWGFFAFILIVRMTAQKPQ